MFHFVLSLVCLKPFSIWTTHESQVRLSPVTSGCCISRSMCKLALSKLTFWWRRQTININCATTQGKSQGRERDTWGVSGRRTSNPLAGSLSRESTHIGGNGKSKGPEAGIS